MYPYDLSICVRKETVYTALYAMLRGEDNRGEMPNRVSIHQRPPEVDDRVIPGHWDDDLIKGRGYASAAGTLVERTRLSVTLSKVADGGAQDKDAVERFQRRAEPN